MLAFVPAYLLAGLPAFASSPPSSPFVPCLASICLHLPPYLARRGLEKLEPSSPALPLLQAAQLAAEKKLPEADAALAAAAAAGGDAGLAAGLMRVQLAAAAGNAKQALALLKVGCGAGLLCCALWLLHAVPAAQWSTAVTHLSALGWRGRGSAVPRSTHQCSCQGRPC